MSVDVWEPGKPSSVSTEQIVAVVEQARQVDIEQLKLNCDEAFATDHAWMMKLEESEWHLAEPLSAEDLVGLIRFFTLAEMQLQGWEAGSKNPVIYLVRMLKSRGEFSAELRKWVRANTDNRFLPNGAAL